MKKAMLCMIFSLLLLFSACSNEIKDAKNDANTVLNTGNTIETSNEYEVEYPLLSIDSLPEYNKFLTEKANNQKLLSYSTLQNIGEFEGITFLSNVARPSTSVGLDKPVNTARVILKKYLIH